MFLHKPVSVLKHVHVSASGMNTGNKGFDLLHGQRIGKSQRKHINPAIHDSTVFFHIQRTGPIRDNALFARSSIFLVQRAVFHKIGKLRHALVHNPVIRLTGIVRQRIHRPEIIHWRFFPLFLRNKAYQPFAVAKQTARMHNRRRFKRTGNFHGNFSGFMHFLVVARLKNRKKTAFIQISRVNKMLRRIGRKIARDIKNQAPASDAVR